jgi:hypothetical protein
MLGIVITKESMTILVNKIKSNECEHYKEHYGDLSIGKCAYYAGIRIGSSLGFYESYLHYLSFNFLEISLSRLKRSSEIS